MMALIAISVNAQSVIAEIDWTQEDSFNNISRGDWYLSITPIIVSATKPINYSDKL